MICWLQLEKRLAPLPHRITSRMHLACLKPAQVCSEAQGIGIRIGRGPVVAECVWMEAFGRAGVGQCCHQVTRSLWSPRENHEAGASEDRSE